MDTNQRDRVALGVWRKRGTHAKRQAPYPIPHTPYGTVESWGERRDSGRAEPAQAFFLLAFAAAAFGRRKRIFSLISSCE